MTYLNVTMEDLKATNISSCRFQIASFMRSKPVDVFIISLIILYTLLVIVYLAIDDVISESRKAVLALQIFELCLLFIF